MWVEKTPSGNFKFIERYKNPLTGQIRRVSVTMDRNTPQSKKAAQIALQEKIEAAIGSSSCPNENITFGQLVDLYLDDQTRSVKKSTYLRNVSVTNSLKLILGKDTLVNRFTAKYIRDRFLSSGKSPGTLNEHLTRLKALLRWGYNNDYIKTVEYLKKIKPFNDVSRRQKIQDKFLESEELMLLLEHMDHENWRLLTQFLVLSGIRFGEAAALLKSDVNLENDIIYITKNYDYRNDEVTSTKTSCSTREVYIQPELKNVCQQILEKMHKQQIHYKYPESDLFFADSKGTHIHYYAYAKYFRETAERVLGRRITPHILRHTHASLLLEKDVSIDTISRRLGHENSQITKEIYLHITEKLKQKDNLQISSIKILQ